MDFLGDVFIREGVSDVGRPVEGRDQNARVLRCAKNGAAIQRTDSEAHVGVARCLTRKDAGADGFFGVTQMRLTFCGLL